MNYKMENVLDLIPYVNNARTHSDSQITQIAASIKEFGFLNPIITDGKNGVIAGHGRLMAAKKLGLEKVPTVEAAHLTDAQRKAYVLADNQLAMNSAWDYDLLKVEIEGLQELDFDDSILGFDDAFLQTLGQEMEIDLDALAELENETESDPLKENLLKAIQIEFPSELHEEAKKILDDIRKDGTIAGEVVLNALKAWLQ